MAVAVRACAVLPSVGVLTQGQPLLRLVGPSVTQGQLSLRLVGSGIVLALCIVVVDGACECNDVVA